MVTRTGGIPRATGDVIAVVTSNVIPLPIGLRWRVLIAHRRNEVCHVRRALIEAKNIAIVEVANAEAAPAQLEGMRFDLLRRSGSGAERRVAKSFVTNRA